MPVSSIRKSKSITTRSKPESLKSKKESSAQANLISSKLIQNLGSGSEQYTNEGQLRSAWGRDLE